MATVVGNPGIALVTVRTIRLDTDTAEAPVDVAATATVGAEQLTLHDAPRARLASYRLSDGALAWTIELRGTARLPSPPNALSWSTDTLTVADVNPAGGVWRVSRFGAVLDSVIPHTDLPITGVRRLGLGWVVSTTEVDDALAAGTARLLRALDRSGRVMAAACEPESTYVASARRRGMISIFRSFQVATAEDRVYCLQPLGSRVQVFDARLASVGTIALPPHAPAADPRQSMDVASIQHFRTGLVEWLAMFPAGEHLWVLGATYDSLAARDRYLAVRCALASTAGCDTFRSDLRVIGVRGDSLVGIGRDERSARWVAALLLPPRAP